MEPILPEVGWMKERFQVRILNDGNKEVLQASGVFIFLQVNGNCARRC